MYYVATEQDHTNQTLPDSVLADAKQAFEDQGFAVIGGLVSQETRDLLYPSVLEDAELVRSGGELTIHEQRTAPGHLQLGLRRYAPYVRPDLVANPLIESFVATLLGEGAWLGFYNGNVNCPGSGRQPLHFDRPYSWTTPEDAAADGVSWPPPATTVSCSLALSEISQDSGPTEIYPGSQRETEVAQWTTNRLGERQDLLEKWGPPMSMTIPAGGVCFRDPRMWHGGVPNHSASPRPMIALTYHAELARTWRGRYVRNIDPQLLARLKADPSLKLMDDGSLGDGRLVFHESTAPAFAAESRHGVCRNARFVSERVDHLVGAHELGGASIAGQRNAS